MVIHTCNPRLHLEQLIYIINHAEDRVLFFDATFAPLIEEIAAVLPEHRGMDLHERCGKHAGARADCQNVYCYEELIAAQERSSLAAIR